MIGIKKHTFKLRTIAAGLAVALSLSTVPARAVESSQWSDNAFLKAIYFDRSKKQRAFIIGGATIAISTLAYLVYRALTRTSLEKNIIALEQLEQEVKKHYWHRIQKEEIEAKPVMPAFKLLLDTYSKNSESLTALTEDEKQKLWEKFITAGYAIHNFSVSKEQLVRVCEVDFFECIKRLKEKINKQQQVEQNKAIKK